MFYVVVYKIDFGWIICLENHITNSSTYVWNEKKNQNLMVLTLFLKVNTESKYSFKFLCIHEC